MSWEDDKLNRKEEADYLVSYIKRKYEANAGTSLSINLNAYWGQGKTYFLMNLKEDLAEDGHPVVYYDAWQNDYSNEALISFISEISEMLSDTLGVNQKVKSKIERFKESGKKLIKSSVPVILSAIVKHLLKTDIESLLSEDGDSEAEKKSKDDIEKDIADTVSKLTSSAATSLLADHKATQSSIKDFRDALKDIVSELAKKEGKLKDKNLPIFVLVDELDRCRPTFAIELLEAIKHLFGVHGIVFITATNTKELQASIKAVYGGEFSANIYLRRFFDLEYTFSKPDVKDFSSLLLDDIKFSEKIISYIEADKKKVSVVELFSIFCTFFKLSLRDMEQLKVSLEACVFYSI